MDENLEQQPSVLPQESQISPPVNDTQPAIAQEVKQGSPATKKYFLFLFLLVILTGVGVVVFSILNNQKEKFEEKSKPTSLITPTVAKQKDETLYSSYQSISLTDPQGGIHSGNATRSIIPEHVFVSVSANLDDPPEGQFYQAWLKNSQGDYVSLGYLFKEVENQYTAVEELPTPTFSSFSKILYNNLVVTQEAFDDTTPETIILQGTFTK